MTAITAPYAAVPKPSIAVRNRQRKRALTGLLLILPGFLLIAALIAYPFVMSIFLSLTDAKISTLQAPQFVGLDNFIRLFNDGLFRQAVLNSFLFTFVAVVFKIGLGLMMALALYDNFVGRRAVTALLLFSWVAPIALSLLTWLWLLDSLYSPINWVLRATGIMDFGLSWLGEPVLAMVSIAIVNVWRGFPFFGLMLLAGLISVPRSLYEAANLDGASGWQKFRLITLPMLRVTLAVLVLYATIHTFNEFAVVQILTRGGPENSTQVFATLAFQRGILSGNLGEASAITLYFMPVFAVLSIVMLKLSWKEREL